MLAHISIDSATLLDGLCLFVEQLVLSISDITAQLAEGNAYLQHVSLSPAGCTAMGPNDGESWGDGASETLGLHVAKADRLYWGRYYQLHPLVSLLGRALKLQAAAAKQAPSTQAAEQLMGAWRQTLDKVLPTHYSNASLIEGLHCNAEALRAIAIASHGDADAIAAIKQKLAALLSLGQLESLMPVLEHNLMSFQHGLRLQTLRLLGLFEQPRMKSSKQGSESTEACDIIQLGVDLETIPAGVDTYKEKTNPLRRMAVYASNGRVPKVFGKVFPFLAIMQFSVNFSLVWTESTKQLALLANANPSLLWSAVWQTLRRYNDERLLVETGLTPEAKSWLSRRQAERATQCELVAQPKLEGFAMECSSLARFDRVFDNELSQFVAGDHGRSDGALSTGLQCLMIAADAQGAERVDYNNVYKQLLKMLAEDGARAA
ncbi:U3 snoRNP protein, partial [Coemansia thaxteri]